MALIAKAASQALAGSLFSIYNCSIGAYQPILRSLLILLSVRASGSGTDQTTAVFDHCLD
jgi:hypothetical protein